MKKINLNGTWSIDYLSNQPYKSDKEPYFSVSETGNCEWDVDCVAKCPVPGYFEDMGDIFRSTPLHTKLSWNPLYTLQRYPQTGYCPDMALPNPVGCFCYVRSFSVSDADAFGDAELYVGGAQNRLSAWINGVYLGTHEGYSCEFFMKIPEGTVKNGENRITLAVSNIRLEGYMGRPVSGLTSRAANECTGGIWGDVEIRGFDRGLRDAYVSVAEDLSAFTVKCIGAPDAEKRVEIFSGSEFILAVEIPESECEITLPTEGFDRWSPENPALYKVNIYAGEDSLERVFGIRRLTSKGMRLYFNGKPYFFRGICEHCYHPITVHPTREKNYYRRLIRTVKDLGFNSIRFHTHVPMPEYMEAADELGIVIEVETPNNTTYEEWIEIINASRRHPSVCAFSSGNEMVIDEDYIEHLRAVAKYVHSDSDALFSPMSAMRGIEYHSFGDLRVEEPFPHNPKRLASLDEFCDLYNSYSNAQTSYCSSYGDPKEIDYKNSIYSRPLLTHEICIHGTYIDLSLKDRYRGSRIGDTEFMSSVEKHLADVGLLDRANLYYRNSVKWQMMLRKHCFETVRRCDTFAGYDFLGDIDTHWHTFGYCVGMMNEFYELKPGETRENVLRYNSDAVLLCDLPKVPCYTAGDKVTLPILVSNYGESLESATLNVRVKAGGEAIFRREIRLGGVENGKITELYTAEFNIPRADKPIKLTLTATLSGGNTDAENTWELYAFPKAKPVSARALRDGGITAANDMTLSELAEKMNRGESVVLFGSGPFKTAEVHFQLSVAGRTNGHLATVIADHPLMRDLPNDGYCAMQFRGMMNGAAAAILDVKKDAHDPIIDIASSYKNAHREAMLFEYKIGKGRLLVSTLNLADGDPAAEWLRREMLDYAMSDLFHPKQELTVGELCAVCDAPAVGVGNDTNQAMNRNDVTM